MARELVSALQFRRSRRCAAGCCRPEWMPISAPVPRLRSSSGSKTWSGRTEISRRPTLSRVGWAIWQRDQGVCVVDGVRDGGDAVGAELPV